MNQCLVGGFETIRTGDLGKGLMAGLGAYGGANIGTALTSMGSKAAAASALPAGGSTALPSAASQAAGESLLAQSLSAPQMSMVPGATGSSLLQAGGSAPLSASSVAALQNQAAQNFAQQSALSQLSQGAKAAMADPGALGSTLYSQMGTKGTIAAATPTALSLAESMQPKYDFPEPVQEKSTYAGPYYPTARTVRYPGDDERRSSREFTFFSPSNPVPFAEGGGVEDRAIRMPADVSMTGAVPEFNYNFRPVEIQGMPFGGSDLANRLASVPASPGGKGGLIHAVLRKAGEGMLDKERQAYANMEGYTYDPQTQRLVKAASGGLVALAEGGEFLKDGSFVIDARTVSEIGNGSSNAGLEILSQLGGRPVDGPGDGVSDSVPAMIEGGQEARVARDEVIFDPETVKAIGGGSAKKGAQRLYALMDRAHKARQKAERGEDTGVGLGALAAA